MCSGCGTRHRAFYDRQTRRVRDTDAAGWHLYLAFEQRRVACSRCQGVKVESKMGSVLDLTLRGRQCLAEKCKVKN
ncbi:MAG: transposase family protein [Nitrospira defluvii]|nr:transposase family protein [Nitrospira defluvii]